MKSWFLVIAATIAGLFGLGAAIKHEAQHEAQASTALVQPAATDVSVVANQSPEVPGSPLTAVVVTQCNGLLAVYLTMPSGELVRFDKDSGLPWATLLDMANTAPHSERIEVSCDSLGVEGYEQGTPPV